MAGPAAGVEGIAFIDCSWAINCFSRSRSRFPSSAIFARAAARFSSSAASFFSRSMSSRFRPIWASSVAFWSSRSFTICSCLMAISVFRAAMSFTWVTASESRRAMSSSLRTSDSRRFASSCSRDTSEFSFASTCCLVESNSCSRLEDGPEDGEPAFPHLDRVFLHRVIDRSHLLDLEIPHELPSGPVQSQHHDAIDEKPLVSKELTLPVRRPLHDHETGEFVVPEHLEEVEHPLPHVGRVLHERVERAERVEGEQLEFVAVHLAVVTDHPLDEGEVVRLVVRADDRIDLPEVREVADLHVHRELDAEGLHVP